MKKAILCTLFFFTLSNAFCQYTGAAALALLDEIDAKVEEHINSIDNMVTNAIGDSGNMILSASARLRKDIESTIGSTDKILRKNQNIFFNRIQQQTESLNKMISENITNITSVSLGISQAINDFIGKKTEPTIINYKISPFIKDYSEDNMVKLTGNTLDRCDSIFMLVNNKKIQYIENTHGSLKFNIPKKVFDNITNGDKFLKGEIIYYWRQGFFKKKKERKDKFIIPVFPLKIATVKIKFEQESPYKKFFKKIEYSTACSTPGRRSGSRRHSSTPFNLLPTKGRYFDVPSIKMESFSQRHGGGFGWTTRTEQQIKGLITCDSDSRHYGGGGFSATKISYREYEKLYSVVDFETKTFEITSANPKVVSLPSPVDGYSARVNYADIMTYDGKQIIVVPNGKNKYFSLQHNIETDDVVVSWRHR